MIFSSSAVALLFLIFIRALLSLAHLAACEHQVINGSGTIGTKQIGLDSLNFFEGER